MCAPAFFGLPRFTQLPCRMIPHDCVISSRNVRCRLFPHAPHSPPTKAERWRLSFSLFLPMLNTRGETSHTPSNALDPQEKSKPQFIIIIPLSNKKEFQSQAPHYIITSATHPVIHKTRAPNRRFNPRPHPSIHLSQPPAAHSPPSPKTRGGEE